MTSTLKQKYEAMCQQASRCSIDLGKPVYVIAVITFGDDRVPVITDFTLRLESDCMVKAYCNGREVM